MRCLDLGPLERVAHDRADAVRSLQQTADRRHRAKEEVPVLAGRPAVLQIRGDGSADIGGQRQQALPAALAADAQLRLVPVDIVQRQPDDLAGAQSQARQKQQHGTITSTDRGGAVAAVDGALRVLGRDRLRDRRRGRPGGDGRHAGDEPGGDLAAEFAEAQEGSQRLGNTLHGRGCHAGGLLSNERDGVAWAKVKEADICLPEAPGQELPCHPRVGAHGGRRQSMVALQVLCEVGGYAVSSRGARSGVGTDPLLAKEEQQQRQRLPFLAPRVGAASAAPAAVALVARDVVVAQRIKLNATPLAPSAEGQCVSRQDARVARRVLLAAQPGDERAEVLSRRCRRSHEPAHRHSRRKSSSCSPCRRDCLAGRIAMSSEVAT